MARLFNIILLFILCLNCFNGQAQKFSKEDSALWVKAQEVFNKEEYKEAALMYEELININREKQINISKYKVEDLRKKYSIDELELQNSIERNKLLELIIITCFFFLIVFIGCFFYLKWEKRKIKIMNQELERATNLEEISMHNKSIFLSNMSHEIRTPLNALSGFSEVLTLPNIDADTREQCNEIIQLNSDLLLKLINDVIDISCLDINKMTFKIERCNVKELCENIIKTISSIKKTNADIIFDTKLSECFVDTDAARLQQVLINILVNATKFTANGTITLKLEYTQFDKIQFSISDTGCGIPLEKQEHIFNRFEKLNEHDQGTGLGLSICQLIIKRLNGNIWIDSSYLDGARFVFTHPIKQKE